MEARIFQAADVPLFDDPPCAGRGDIFFPDSRRPGYRAAVAEAQAICATCPHIEPCGRGAEERDEKFGVWGGVLRLQHTTPPSPPPEQPDAKHGTGRYRKGCRCDVCRAAASDYQARRSRTTPAQAAWRRGVGFPLVLDDAPCAGLADIFVPDRTKRGSELLAGLAQAICGTCAHSDQCRAAAQERREEWGVWGGWDAYAAGPLARNRAWNDRQRARLPA